MGLPTISPPPIATPLVGQGLVTQTWARWLDSLAKNARGLSTFRAFNQATDNWDTNPASKTSGAFMSSGGTLIIFASSSAYSASGSATIGFYVGVDGVRKGQMAAWTDEAHSHKACVPAFMVVPGIGAGSHTIKVEQFAGQTADVNDPLDCVVVELPL